MEVGFPTDADGFLSQECPSCELRFKIQFGQGSEEPISYCPYCGHKGQDCWHTTEQVEHLKSVAISTVIAPELKKFHQRLKGASKGLVKFSAKISLPEPLAPPMETDEAFDILHFPCCGETIKVNRQDHLFCIICGKEINMATSDSKKVFLSHKGVDKGMVIDFKKTLELLGFSPWLDEDAMPAGTTLERGLLKGMQESCGVVFFITPSFKDQGYLETEVNYAIREKRAKGDKFAIIALQFEDVDGAVGEIPELLKDYVWKKPKTQLEAIREIVRALPVVPGTVDWRSEITGVVTMPKMKSTTTELSAEAKSILKTAVHAGGRIMHVRYSGGEAIQVGTKSMIPDGESRTVARWVGGLEDLQRRRYVKALGHKGEVLEVTREGYEAADELPND